MTGRRVALVAATAALTAALGAWLRPSPAAADLRTLVAPGPLAQQHVELEARCDACHVPFKGVPDSACLACHEKTAARLRSGRGTHAAFAREGKACIACHGDHKGRRHALTPAVDPGFDHAATGAPLGGAHARVACEKCHTRNPGGTTRWIELPATCAGCHRDVHGGALGARCEPCHTEAGWKPPRHALAEHKVPLDGRHAGLECAACHGKGAHLGATSSCGDCHRQSHGGTRAPCITCHNTDGWKQATFTHDFCTCILPGKHQTAPCLACHPAFKFAPTPNVCAGCHERDRKHEDLGGCARCHSALSWKARAFDHDAPRVGFAIAGQHQAVGCENCHKKKGVFRGAPRRCAGCHAVPAHGDFGGCERCHVTSGFLDTTFSHATTRFPIEGAHVGVGCPDCHQGLRAGQFQPGPNACALCHGNPHGPQFGGPAIAPPRRPSPAPAAPPRATPPAPAPAPTPTPAPPAAPPPRGRAPAITPPSSMMATMATSTPLPFRRGARLLAAAGAATVHVLSAAHACLDCHTTTGWKPATVDAGNHGRFGYPLEGGHGKVACARCHDQGRYAGTPRECAACHLDRHGGRFGGDCQRCHEVAGWKRAAARFDHRAEAGFALAGAHAPVACAACHGADGRALDGKQPVGCATCHATDGPRGHGAQFGGDCVACHQPTRFADVPRFDHGRTHLPLERRHAALACLACHSAARGARLDPECRTCHGDPHRGRTTLDCADCHRADSWNRVRFDHDRTEFRLNGRHFVVTCRECHVGDVYSGTRRECLFCHRGERMRANMTVGGHGQFNLDCSCCHNAFGFKPATRPFKC